MKFNLVIYIADFNDSAFLITGYNQAAIYNFMIMPKSNFTQLKKIFRTFSKFSYQLFY
jgi:hypothetical protein